MRFPVRAQEKLWKALSRFLRRIHTNCERCGIAAKDTPEGFLHGHHIGNRHHYGNESITHCPFNVIILCQKCHVEIEPTSYHIYNLVHTDAAGNELKVECCGRGLNCQRYRSDRKIAPEYYPNFAYREAQKKKKLL
jgi:hypothetical protein